MVKIVELCIRSFVFIIDFISFAKVIHFCQIFRFFWGSFLCGDFFSTTLENSLVVGVFNNIYNDGELDKGSTCSILEHIGNAGTRIYYTAYLHFLLVPSAQIGKEIVLKDLRELHQGAGVNPRTREDEIDV